MATFERLEGRTLWSVLSPSDLAIIDTAVTGSSELAAAWSGEVLFYDSTSESAGSVLHRATNLLRGGTNRAASTPRSVAIFSHGTAGAFQLGRDVISNATLDQTSAAWHRVGGAMGNGGVLRIYSCSVAAVGSSGQHLLNRLSGLSGATVQASTTPTGRGGDWILEVTTGNSNPTAAAPLDVARLSNYTGTLAAPVVTTTGPPLAYTENGSATAIDLGLTLAHSNATLTGATVAITGHYQTGQDVLAFTNQNGITGSWNAATGTLALSGSATVAQYQAALRSVTYRNTSDDPTRSRTALLLKNASFQEDSGWWYSPAGWTGTVPVHSTSMFVSAPTGADGARVAAVYGPGGNTLETAAAYRPAVNPGSTYTMSFKAGSWYGNAVNDAVFSLVWYDAAGNQLSATSYTPTILAAPVGSPIQSFNFSGTAPAGAASVAVKVVDPSDHNDGPVVDDFRLGLSSRTVSFTVTDGSDTSTAATRGINVSAVNDAPTVTTAAAAVPTAVTGTSTALSVRAADPDHNEPSLTYTWSATTRPAGSNPVFSVNGTNAAKDTVVTFDKAGSYTFTVTISDGSLTTTSIVSVTVDPALRYKFDGTAGNSSLGNSNGGTPSNGPVLTTTGGRDGGALSLDGVDDYVGLGTYDVGDRFTISGWIYLPDVHNSVVILANGQGGSASTGFRLMVNTWNTQDRRLVFETGNGTSGITIGSTANAVPVNEWTHVAVVVDRPGQSLRLYANGVDVTTAANWVVNNFQTNAPLQIGAHANGGGYFQGMIDDLRLYTRKLSAAEVAELASAGATAPGSLAVDLTGRTTARLTWSDSSGETGYEIERSTDGVNWSLIGTAPADAVSYTDAALTHGATYHYRVRADNGTFDSPYSNTATVLANRLPTTIDDAYSTNEDTPLVRDAAIGVLANDADVDGDTLVAQLVTDVTHGTLTLHADGSFTYTPAGNYAGSDGFSYRTFDGTSYGTVKTVSFTVTAVNDAPAIVTAAAATPSVVTTTTTGLSVLGQDVDDADASLAYTWSVASAPARGNPVFSVNGDHAAANTTVTFDLAGTYTFAVTVVDPSGAAAVSQVTVVVQPTLTALVVTPMTAAIHADALPLTVVAFDQFGRPLVPQPAVAWSLISGAGAIDASGRYTPTAPGQSVIRATAGQLIAEAVVTINNVLPATAPDAYWADQDSPLWVDADDGLLANDADADHDPLRAELASDPAHGVLTIFDDGSFAYVPHEGYSGLDQFSYRVHDGFEWSEPVTVMLWVRAAPGQSPVEPVLTPDWSERPMVDEGRPDEPDAPLESLPKDWARREAPLFDDRPIEAGTGSPAGSGGGRATAGGRDPGHTGEPKPDDTTPPAQGKEAVSGAEPPAGPPPNGDGGDGGDSGGEPGGGQVDGGGGEARTAPTGQRADRLADTQDTSDEAELRQVRLAPLSHGELATAQALAQAYEIAARDPEGQAVLAASVEHAEEQAAATRQVAGVSAAVTSVVAATYLVWLIQGGSLLASLFTAMPFWRWFDPLPVVDAWEKSRDAQRRKSRRWWRFGKSPAETPAAADERRIEDLLK